MSQPTLSALSTLITIKIHQTTLSLDSTSQTWLYYTNLRCKDDGKAVEGFVLRNIEGTAEFCMTSLRRRFDLQLQSYGGLTSVELTDEEAHETMRQLNENFANPLLKLTQPNPGLVGIDCLPCIGEPWVELEATERVLTPQQPPRSTARRSKEKKKMRASKPANTHTAH